MTRIFVAGHRGMVGSAIVRALSASGKHEIIVRTRDELDLRNQSAVRSFFEQTSIDEVYLAAARVGGIYANNTYPADFIYDNLIVEANVIHQAYATGIQKLLFLGSSCIYPVAAAQPMAENALLTGPLEPTNEPYAIAKIAGIKLCESYNRQYGITDGLDYRSVMPTNLYGKGDNYHPENSHVVPALIRKVFEAKHMGAAAVTIWGSGSPRREFLNVDDMASASLYVMNLAADCYHAQTTPMNSHINVGSGDEISILELAKLIAAVIGYEGDIVTDLTKPDGAPRKLMDSARIRSLGWSPKISLPDGLSTAVEDFRSRFA